MDKIQRRFICEAIDDPDNLSEWEYDFIQSLADKDDSHKLSEKQNSILNRISQKYVNKGW